MKVVITGASGYVAGRVLPALRERYQCMGFASFSFTKLRCQISFPVLRSRQFSIPVEPAEKIRSPRIVGVARGPTPPGTVSYRVLSA